MNYDENGERVLEAAQTSPIQYDSNGERIPDSSSLPPTPHISNADRSFEIRKKKMSTFDPFISKHASENGLDPNIIRAMILVESNKDVSPESTNDATSATGLGQLTTSTAKQLGVVDATDPNQNISGMSKYIAQNYSRFGGDMDKAVVAYHDGPNAVRRYEKQYGKDWKKGISPEGQEHLSRFDNYLTKLGGVKDNNAPLTPELDTRDLAGLPPQQYPGNEKASTLFNNPQAQQQSVQETQKQAISDLPLREQMGSGVGAFAYKFPGMGKLSELAGLAPKGSAQDKKQTIADYNQNRSLGQLAGEMTPDVLASSLGGVAATKAMQIGKIGSNALKYLTEGATLGGVSAGMHQAQHLGSGEQLQPKEAAAEVLSSAGLGLLGGKIGDKLREVAPKILQKAVRPTYSEQTAANPPNFTAALEEGLVPKTGGLDKAQAITDAKMNQLNTERTAAAKQASYTFNPAKGPKVAPPPGSAPIKETPIQAPEHNLSDLVPQVQQTSTPVNSTKTPGYFPLSQEEQTARKAALIDADKARRVAEATARRNASVSSAATPQQIAMSDVNGSSKEASLSSLASKQAALRSSPIPQAIEDKGYTKADQKLLNEAFGAEKSNKVLDKLKGQRGMLDLFPTKPDATTATPRQQWSDMSAKDKLTQITQLQTKMMNAGIPQIENGKVQQSFLSKLGSKLSNQDGSLLNPFAKSSEAPMQGPLQQNRSIKFTNGPLKDTQDALDKEMLDPVKRKLSTASYQDAKDALEHWKAEAKARPTAKGQDEAHMTPEDALSFRQTIDKDIKYKRSQGTLTDGYQKASLMLRNNLNTHIATAAPEVGNLTSQEARIIPFQKALHRRVIQEGNKSIINPMTIKLASLAGGAALGSTNGNNRGAGAVMGGMAGLSLAHLATTPGGAAILYGLGKSLSDNTSVRKNITGQLARTALAKSREKK